MNSWRCMCSMRFHSYADAELHVMSIQQQAGWSGHGHAIEEVDYDYEGFLTRKLRNKRDTSEYPSGEELTETISSIVDSFRTLNPD